MKLFLKTPKNVDDLEAKHKVQILASSLEVRRQSARILVVDDTEFAPLENLKRHNFHIVRLSDITSIGDVTPYQIILCDLLGVGRELNPSLQGAHLIQQIKKTFPEKFVVAYTRGSASNLIQASILVADRFTQKDTSIEDWTELLDDIINDLSNPAYVWRKMRYRLLDAGVTPYQLTILEDTFVANYVPGSEDSKQILLRKADALNLKQEARSMINSLISNALFYLITN
jgi:hypothetical protein